MWEPFGTVPANSTAYWRSSPNGRGTYTILSSCIITLTLCVYTSLHLDIPGPGKVGIRHHWRRKIHWVLIGLVAPEIVAAWSFHDWLHVRIHAKEMKDFLKPLQAALEPEKTLCDATEPTCQKSLVDGPSVSGRHVDVDLEASVEQDQETNASSIDTGHVSEEQFQQRYRPRKHAWTITHSHFASMGGFTIKTTDFPFGASEFPNIEIAEFPRLMLTLAALCKLAEFEPAVLPDLSEELLLDKSKANGLTKLLVCLQTGWFSVQAIGRLATGLPISLLELNTFIHALCCLLTYVAWWHKPLDVDVPVYIEPTERTKNLFTFLYVNDRTKSTRSSGSSWEATKLVGDGMVNRWPELNMADGKMEVLVNPQNLQAPVFRYYIEDVGEEFQATLKHLPVVGIDPANAILRLYLGQRCFGYRLVRNVDLDGDVQEEFLMAVEHNLYDAATPKYIDLNVQTVECLRIAQAVAEEGVGAAFETEEGAYWLDDKASFNRGHDDVYENRKVWRNQTSLQLLTKGIFTASAIYGGIHLLAWDGPFQSMEKRWLWRISCFIISAPVLLAPIRRGCRHCFRHPWMAPIRNVWIDIFIKPVIVLIEFIYGQPKGTPWDIPSWVLHMGDWDTYVYLVFYCAARVYLIVECFVSLANLPPEVYDVPAWSRYIPHLSAG